MSVGQDDYYRDEVERETTPDRIFEQFEEIGERLEKLEQRMESYSDFEYKRWAELVGKLAALTEPLTGVGNPRKQEIRMAMAELLARVPVMGL